MVRNISIFSDVIEFRVNSVLTCLPQQLLNFLLQQLREPSWWVK